MRSFLILLVVLLFADSGLCQNHKIDSLKSLLPVKSNINGIDLLVDLAIEYGEIDINSTYEYANEAFDIAKELGDSLRMVKTGRVKSQALKKLGKIEKAINLYNEMLLIAKRHHYKAEMKSILNGLGSSYLFKANYDHALKFYFESLKLREDDGDKFEISVVLNNIGLVHSILEDYDRAIEYYKGALKLRLESKNNWGVDILYLNVSLCYGLKKVFPEARNFAEQGLSTCGKTCSEESLLLGKHIFGLIFFEQQNFPKAETEFLQSNELSKKIGDQRFYLANVSYLTRIYILRNQFQLAEKYLKEVELLIDSGLPYNDEIIEIYAQLISLYSKSENFKKVAFYQNKYITLKDSIYNKELTTNLMKIEADHLEKENRAKIEFQNRILALNDQVIHSQKIVNFSVGTIAFLLIILAILLAKSNRQKRIANRLLDEKVRERTQTLVVNRDALQRVCEEHDALILKASSDIKSSIATIKGLCFLGLKGIDHPNAAQYLGKMDSVSDQLSDVLNKMFYSYKLGNPSK